MKSNKDNNMTEHTGLIYTKTEIELSWIIWLGAVCDENHINELYIDNDTKLSWLIELSAIYYKY